MNNFFLFMPQILLIGITIITLLCIKHFYMPFFCLIWGGALNHLPRPRSPHGLTERGGVCKHLKIPLSHLRVSHLVHEPPPPPPRSKDLTLSIVHFL